MIARGLVSYVIACLVIPADPTKQGAFASVGNSMVGGTIADIYTAKSRGIAMNVFSITIFFGQVNRAPYGLFCADETRLLDRSSLDGLVWLTGYNGVMAFVGHHYSGLMWLI